MQTKEKLVLITGGGSGIGLALSKSLTFLLTDMNEYHVSFKK